MQQIQSRQFEGRLQRMTDSYLDVSGRRIYRDSQTRIDSNVRVGQEVKVTFVIENDRWLARRVQRD